MLSILADNRKALAHRDARPGCLQRYRLAPAAGTTMDRCSGDSIIADLVFGAETAWKPLPVRRSLRRWSSASGPANIRLPVRQQKTSGFRTWPFESVHHPIEAQFVQGMKRAPAILPSCVNTKIQRKTVDAYSTRYT